MSTRPEKEKTAIATNFSLSFSLLLFWLLLSQLWFTVFRDGLQYLFGGEPTFWTWIFIAILLSLSFAFIMRVMLDLTMGALL